MALPVAAEARAMAYLLACWSYAPGAYAVHRIGGQFELCGVTPSRSSCAGWLMPGLAPNDAVW